MSDIDTSLLRSFLTLAETGNFTRTAEKVGRSQSAVSMQIARLEDILNTRLFIRDKRNVALTPDGEKLIGYARQMLGLSSEMVGRFRDPEIAGEIRFGSPEDFATFHLPGILGNFARTHPRVALHVNCELTLSLIEGFENNAYDIIVIKQAPDAIYPGARPLWRERLVWVGGPETDQRTKPSDLTDANTPLPLVLSPSPCVYRARATKALDGIGLPWQVIYTSPSVAGAMAAVRAGLGYAVLPRKMVGSDLVPLEKEAGWPALEESEICLLCRAESDAATHALADFIVENVTFNQKN